ncbi:flagella synthesis protein FlgN [Methylophaga sp. OBS3]|uniref:flagella synthesis protein FlgN n=1 Tax=Methylophaga sp. OBS3 TaxID=2991934 RepID=UPI0022506204|nr:flagellar protein FlgN [Methylophaga sp. OBS3]MCX4190591.1 flagellar protein FlgN [Methylophaga sp. OBS3]
MSMTLPQQLYSTLMGELQLAQQLGVILDTERKALTQADGEALDKCVRAKQPLIKQLEQLGRQRDLILKTAGFPTGKQGMEAFIANQPDAEAAAINKILGQLKVQATQCRDNNQINGGIVNVNRQYLQRALSIMRGRDPELSAYGPGGEYTSAVVRQPLIGRV